MNSTSQQRSHKPSNHPVSFCCVPGCINTRQRDKSTCVNLSYYRFPLSDAERTKLWVDRIRRKYWFPKSTDRICSIHFKGGEKSDDPQKPGYIPSVFPSHQKVIKRRTIRSPSTSTPPPAKRFCCKILQDSPASYQSTVNSDENSFCQSNVSSDENSSCQSNVSSDENSSCQSNVSSDANSSCQITANSDANSSCQITANSDENSSSKSTVNSDENSSSLSTVSSDKNSFQPDSHQEHLTTTPEAMASRMDHDYVYPYVDYTDDEVERLKHKIILLKQENEDLKKMTLCLASYKDNDDDFYYMTNLPNHATFEALAKYLHRRCDGELNYRRHQHPSNNPRSSAEKSGESLSFREEMFLVLARLKRGLEFKDTSLRTGISISTLSRMFTTWINFLNNELTLLFEMPPIDLSQEQTISSLEPVPEMRFNMDCTELFCQRLKVRKETTSNFKHYDTVEFQVGLSPHLAVNFVSVAWGRRATDRHFSSERLPNAPRGSSVMAERGFLVTEELRALGVKMVTPYLEDRDRTQFPAAKATRSASINRARINIEGLIRRIKTFEILDKSIRIDQKKLVEQTFRVCAYLVNLQPPIAQS